MSTINHQAFRDVADDSIEISRLSIGSGEPGLYIVAHQDLYDDGDAAVSLRFSPEASLRIRQHILDLFPLEEDVTPKSELETGVLVESVFNPSPSITININSLTVNA